jgi:ElaB/YqjD/DUF883 family membrane-anchored ribosome-binding protein
MSRMNNPGKGSDGGHAADNLKDKAAEVTENLRDIGGHVREAAGEKYDQLRQQAGDYYREGREKAQEFEHNLETYVQEKPLQAILIAAGVGMLLGLLWKRH